MEGHSPDDSLLVDLVVYALNQQSEGGGGWILLDFPKTRDQAVLLERELSGYEDAKPAKKGDIKRAKEAAKPVHRNKTLIASADTANDITAALPMSGIDIVFLLDVPNEIAFNRAAGQLIDPISQKSYHIELDPPPKNVPVLFNFIAGYIR